MARKRKAIHGHAAHIHGDKAPVSKRQKVDWSTIDDFKGFTITAANTKPYKKPVASKNNKTGAEVKTPKYPGQDAPLDANVVQQNPFPETKLSTVHVKISPALHWESTTRYRKFTINSEEFQVNQLVFVKNGEDSDGANPPHTVEGWLAKILEIRAGDSSHVFLRVFWAYRPEDLPGGRQPHHGASEIIVSNHMDIIEPLTVQSLADVVHWNDDPDSLPLPADQLFFRQSYDVTKKSNPFSALNKYCIDKQPINPDELLVQCPHCSDWLHAHCLEQQAIRDICEKHKKRGRPSKRAKANSDDLAAKPSLDAKLSASDAGKTRLTITENPTSEDKTRQWDVDISCLVCGKVIETAEDALKPVDSSASPGVTEDTESENVTVATAAKDGPPQDTVKSDPDAAPTDPAKTNAPKKRGRPPGFTNQKRKRISTSPESKAVLPEAKCLKMMTVEEEENSAPDAAVSATTMQDSPKPTTTTKTTTTTTTTATTPATSVLSDATKTTTPEPAPMPDSVFQSGVLSVKQLLWGA